MKNPFIVLPRPVVFGSQVIVNADQIKYIVPSADGEHSLIYFDDRSLSNAESLCINLSLSELLFALQTL